MIDSLIQGRLLAAPQERTSKAGNVFVTARVRVAGAAAGANDDSLIVTLCAFSEPARNALMALDIGDGIAAAGTLKLGTWLDKTGTAKVNADMAVSQVMSAYAVTRKRAAPQPHDQDIGQQRASRDRHRPADEAWRARASADRARHDHSGLDDGSDLPI